MRTIEIITINDLLNYGNRLQNYAIQHILSEKGFYPENIVDETIFPEMSNNVFGLKTCVKRVLYLFRYLLGGSLKTKIIKWNNQITRKENFNEFNKFVNYSRIKVKNLELTKIPCVDKYFIVGSDQVWNPYFSISPVTLLENVKCENKIAFSASFGVESITYDKRLSDCFDDFKAISVREEAGAKIIKDLTGKDATVLVDPTMLLTTDEWVKVSKKPKGAEEGYILTYFLSPKCDEAIKKLNEIRTGKEVYELLNPEDEIAGSAGPSEFLWLFNHAECILTDSFHACVFSFLFNKPFVVYDRNLDGENMNSRLETLLSKFHIERKYANSGLPNEIWEHDYTEGYKQLEIERKKAIDFLKKALED